MTYQPSPLRLQRESARRQASRRSTTIALLSTLAVGVLVVIVITGAKGFQLVRESFFSWHYAVHSFPSVLSGIWLNLRVMVIAEAFVLIFGLLLALARTSKSCNKYS